MVQRYCIYLLFAALFSTYIGKGQDDNPLISIRGKVTDPENLHASFPMFMVVNKATGRGFFGNDDGSFSITVHKNDSIIVSVIGYNTVRFCFKDSVLRENYSLLIPLKKLTKDLQAVDVFPERNLDRVEEDIQKLGYDEKDYRLTGIDAWASPLTALYQQFSKKEKDRRRAAELWNDDQRNSLLKELLRIYNKHELIQLAAEKQDAFIDYLHVSDSMLRSWSQYELAVYIKSKYERFVALNK